MAAFLTEIFPEKLRWSTWQIVSIKLPFGLSAETADVPDHLIEYQYQAGASLPRRSIYPPALNSAVRQ
jgi:hypothetical protein